MQDSKKMSKLSFISAVAFFVMGCETSFSAPITAADLQVCTAAYFQLLEGGAMAKPSTATVDQARSLVGRLEVECPQCYLQRATCRAVVGDYSGAEKELKSAAELVKVAKLQGRRDIENADTSVGEYLGDIYYLAGRYLDAASTYRGAAVESNPLLLGLYRKIGRAYESAGLYVEAEKSWTEVIKLSQKKFGVIKADPPQTCRQEEIAAYISLVKMQIAAKQCVRAANTLREAKLTNPVCPQWKFGEWREDIHCS